MLTFELLGTDGLGAPGRMQPDPRRGRDAGVHAGGHLRHRQGRDARGAAPRRARRSSSATPIHLWLRPGARRAAPVRRPAPLRELARARSSPTAAASRSGRLRERARSPSRASSSRSPVNGDAAADTRGQHADPERAEQRHRDGVRRVHRRTGRRARHRRGRRAALDAAQPALGGALPRRVRAAREPNALFGIVQGGMFEHLRAESRRRARRRSTCPATRSAASASASRTAEMQRIVAHTPRACRRTSRAT